MSPLVIRRYRADRLLRDEFTALRCRVLPGVRARLAATGVSLDRADLEECYAQAWHGLYAALLDGAEIASPGGWLTVVTFRRAIEEHRARRGHAGEAVADLAGREEDIAARLDDSAKLRQLLEGLRGRLSAREREAAAMCYLQGLSRAEAAMRMGLSEARMRKLMDGAGPGRPGVAGKVGALVRTIADGGWCEEQGSLMRALAYGVLDPDGERYRLAVLHRRQCPACRTYVRSLRGLAAAMPPPLLPFGLAAGAVASAGVGGGASAGVGGALSASGAAGAGGAAGAVGGASGGWLLAGGPLAAKLTVGCLIALGIGAGCVVLTAGGSRSHVPLAHEHAVRARAGATYAHAGSYASLRATAMGAPIGFAQPRAVRAQSRPAAASVRLAGREFSPEQGGASGAPAPAQPGASSAGPRARAASVPLPERPPAPGASPSAAEREFAPG